MSGPAARPDEIVIPVVDEGLGNSAYVVDLGDGRALAIDPSRDLRQIDEVTRRRGRIAIAAETHLHADFVSGRRGSARGDGARVLASAAGGREFPHVGLRDGDEVELGGLRCAPGDSRPHPRPSRLPAPRGSRSAVFTGGSLMVGAAARTDLVSPIRANRWPGRSSGRCTGWLSCPTTCLSIRRTVPVRSAPPRRRGAHHDHRPGEGHERPAAPRRRRPLRRGAAGLAWAASRLLSAASRAEPARACITRAHNTSAVVGHGRARVATTRSRDRRRPLCRRIRGGAHSPVAVR